MEEFAKIFTNEDLGQMLVKIDTDQEGAPRVGFYFKPEDMGVCYLFMNYNDDDSGWTKAENIFARADANFTEKVILNAVSALKLKES